MSCGIVEIDIAIEQHQLSMSCAIIYNNQQNMLQNPDWGLLPIQGIILLQYLNPYRVVYTKQPNNGWQQTLQEFNIVPKKIVGEKYQLSMSCGIVATSITIGKTTQYELCRFIHPF